MACASPRLQRCVCAVAPVAAMASCTSCNAASPRAQVDTAAPAPAKASAMARPIPLLPPATTTRYPEKSNTPAAFIHRTLPSNDVGARLRATDPKPPEGLRLSRAGALIQKRRGTGVLATDSPFPALKYRT